MSVLGLRYFTALLLILYLSSCSLFQKPIAAVTGDPLATEAATKILKQGGTAADAFITAVLVLTNVEPQASGLGGGFFAIYYDAKAKRTYALDAREEQPRNLSQDIFWDYSRGKPKLGWFTSGASIGVPGVADGMAVLHKHFGKLGRDEIVQPALAIAENGFEVTEYFYMLLQKYSDLHPWGDYQIGDQFINKDYAGTLKLLAVNGFEAFYNGALAEAIVQLGQEGKMPSAMDIDDLKNYRAVFRQPQIYNYGQYQIVSIGSPSSGSSTLYRIFDLVFAGINEYKAIDASYKIRNTSFGDEDFTESECRVKEDAFENLSELDSFTSSVSEEQGDFASELHEEKGTTHIAITDRYGNAISGTVTIQSAFGSGRLLPGYGFLLNNELSDFDPKRGKCNSIQSWRRLRAGAIGLTSDGQEANKTYGAKRPRSSMTPMIVFEAQAEREIDSLEAEPDETNAGISSLSKPVMILGASGGWTIINSVYQVFTNIIDSDMNLEAAIQAPRVFIKGDGKLYDESELSFPTAVNGIVINGNDLSAYADKRKNGSAQVDLF